MSDHTHRSLRAAAPRGVSRFSRLLTAGLPLLFACAIATPAQAQWTQVWADDFGGTAGSAPDPGKWVLETGTGWGTGEVEYATDSRANSYIDGNGNLVIAMLYDAATNRYTAARMVTAGKYATPAYGRIEARIKNPYAKGVGAAFWALGNNTLTSNVPWPWCGEVDIMEITANTPGHNGGTIHGGQTDSLTNYEYGGLSSTVDLPAGQLFSQAFHVFGVNLGPYHVTFDMDGVTYGDVNLANLGTTDIWPLNQPLYLILSAGVGAGNSGQPDGTGFPTNMTVDYVHVYQLAAGAPVAPTGLVATPSKSNLVSLQWNASSTAGVTYNVYASNTANFTPSLDNLVIQNLPGTSYAHGGLNPGTTYYYKVVASNFGGESTPAAVQALTPAVGNSAGFKLSAGGYSVGDYLGGRFVLGGNTNYHPYVPINTANVANPAPQQVYQTERWGASAWTIGTLTPKATYQVVLHFVEMAYGAAGRRLFNVSVNSATALTNFDIYQAAGGQNRAVTRTYTTKANENGVIEVQTTYGTSSDTTVDLNPTIAGIDLIPVADTGTPFGATPGNLTSLAVNSGGPAVGSFLPDAFFNGGVTATTTNTISIAGVANAAPAAVYQSQRYVPFTYVMTGLVAGATYNARLHFAETYWTAAGQRLFNVALNGSQVLTNFDVFAQAGGQNKALVKTFTANADMYGQIILQFIYAGADQPTISGVELVQTAAPIGAPGNLTASFTSPSVQLTWSASSTAGVTYSVYRSTSAGFVPSASTLIASGLTALTYTDSAVSTNTTYYYLIVANQGSNQSYASNQASATTGTTPPVTTTVSINAGGPAVGSFLADTSFTGGGTAVSTNTINVTGVANAAPAAVYQSERAGNFTYTVSNLTAGAASTVRLHFAEFYFTQAGQRTFNVSINGTPVLTNFDIVAVAGANKANVQTFTATANATGQIIIQFTGAGHDQPKVSGIEVSGGSTPPTTGVAINAGGAAAGTFIADTYFTGGGTAVTANTITTTGVTNPAPVAVYQSERAGQFTYTVPNLAAGNHTVRLHFAEFYFTAAGQRTQNVSINGTTVLSNFDIVAAAGGANKANIQQFTAAANASGQIVIAFTNAGHDQPKVSGIEVQ